MVAFNICDILYPLVIQMKLGHALKLHMLLFQRIKLCMKKLADSTIGACWSVCVCVGGVNGQIVEGNITR